MKGKGGARSKENMKPIVCVCPEHVPVVRSDLQHGDSYSSGSPQIRDPPPGDTMLFIHHWNPQKCGAK